VEKIFIHLLARKDLPGKGGKVKYWLSISGNGRKMGRGRSGKKRKLGWEKKNEP